MNSIELFSSINSLVLTFAVVGFGYLSIMLGYAMAGKREEFFSGKLAPTDKMTLSFIIGSLSFLSLITLFKFESISLMENLVEISIYQSILSATFAFFIAHLLKN